MSPGASPPFFNRLSALAPGKSYQPIGPRTILELAVTSSFLATAATTARAESGKKCQNLERFRQIVMKDEGIFLVEVEWRMENGDRQWSVVCCSWSGTEYAVVS